VTQAQNGTLTVTPPASINAIREADLRSDLAIFAGDAMRGRESGTVDELRASVWLAEQMEKIGVKPAGDMGSWFQWWNMRRTRISPLSSVKLGDRSLTIWSDIEPVTNATGDLDAPTAFVTNLGDSSLNLAGKVAVAALTQPPSAQVRSTTNTHEFNYTRAAIVAMGNQAIKRGAVGLVIVADSLAESAFNEIGTVQSRGTYDVPGGAPRFRGATPNPNALTSLAQTPRPFFILLAHQNALPNWRTDGQPVDMHIRTETFDYPSNNVIGIVRGTDSKLRDEYVMFSAHTDHDGVRYPLAGDSIWNGADDNGSTSVALLAIARAWVKNPGKRSAIFIFHGAEERGLLGSRYHAMHPIVPLDRIAAVFNGDMIGRNSTDTAALLGTQPPHRNSTALVAMGLAANKAVAGFVIDSSWDRPNHPEGFYFRSDHAPYAALNVPALYFTSMLHSDYHTPRDEPGRINYPKLTRMAKWMYLTGWMAANAPVRPALDSGFVLR
jgi:hypothetical protein